MGESSEEDGPTPKSKKKLKLMTSTPKAKKQLSDPESGSGMDLMGIDSDDESALKAKKLKKKKSGKVDQKKVSKKKSGEKSGDSFSGGSDMDSDEKAYRKKQKKREKSKQLDMGTRVDIQYLNKDIKAELKEYDEVDI